MPPSRSAMPRKHSATRSSAQQEIAKRAYDRTTRLVAQQAATTQQLDQAERDYRVLGDQIKAQDEQIKAVERRIAAQTEQVQTARAQVETGAGQVSAAAGADQPERPSAFARRQVTSPIAGTVLTTYAKAGEVVQVGQPLFKIASLDSVEVRAYVTEPQLAAIRLGQEARVSVDRGRNQRQTLTGTISWISSQAEFTPTNIQTREERAGPRLRHQDSASPTRTACSRSACRPTSSSSLRRPRDDRCLPTMPSSSITCRSNSGRRSPSPTSRFTVHRAERFGFIGPDGAGKTTLFRILTTLMTPGTGNARVLGRDVVADLWALRRAHRLHAGPLLALSRSERRREPALLRLGLRHHDRA